MKDIIDSIEIGSELTIDVKGLKERVPERLKDLINKNTKGKVIGLKMTDGGGIGIILELEDKTNYWFFSEEIKELSDIVSAQSNQQSQETRSSVRNLYQKNEPFEIIHKDEMHLLPLKGKGIIQLINPLYFWNWLRYSTKDIL